MIAVAPADGLKGVGADVIKLLSFADHDSDSNKTHPQMITINRVRYKDVVLLQERV